MTVTPSILAKSIRSHTLRMVHKARASHVGSCFSMADIIAVLYARILHFDPSNPSLEDRDRFILSKGHAAAVLYATLAECGFFPVSHLESYCENGSYLTGHINHHVPGVEVSTGSLGHGLPIACGMALVAKRQHLPYKIYVMLSDGELDEGSNWEAILFAAHHHLNNLVVIVDYNKIQSFGTVAQVLGLEPLSKKWQSFGWTVQEIDGHNFDQIESSLRCVLPDSEKPCVIIANTIKGKGISFMENQLAWHYKSPNLSELSLALNELEYSL